MRAIGFYRAGGPEVLEEMEVSDPAPSIGEVVIRPSYTSVNNLDILVRSGIAKTAMQSPYITGTDIVGSIESVGKGVTGLVPGEKVVASTVFGCGQCASCSKGEYILCSNWKVPGLHSRGSYGELVALPASIVMKKPSGFSEEELGCMPLALSASWRSIKTEARALEGETIAIRGASGNVGIFSILVAKALGLHIIAITRSEQKAAQLRHLGAETVVIAKGAESAKEVNEATSGLGADIVIDPIGATMNDSISMLKNGGRLVLLGTIGGAESNISIKNLYWKSPSIYGVHNASLEELMDAFAEFGRKNMHPVIGRKMKITQASEAHGLFSSGAQFGKILLKHAW